MDYIDIAFDGFVVPFGLYKHEFVFGPCKIYM